MEAGCGLHFDAISRTAGTFQAREHGREGLWETQPSETVDGNGPVLQREPLFRQEEEEE